MIEGIGLTQSDEKSVQFHVKCFYVWEAERRRAAPPNSTSTFAADIARTVLGPDDHLFAS